jgi:hypothetical protein
MPKKIVTYKPDCALHCDSRSQPCAGTRFELIAERPATDNDYRCLTCGAIVVGDEHSLAINRSHKKSM